MSTKEVAAEIAAFEAANPNARGIPKALKNKYQNAYLSETQEQRVPITWKGRQAFLESHGTRTTRPGADKWKVVYFDQRVKKGNTNRAQRADQKITRQDYRDFASRNGYTLAQADKLFEANEAKLAQIQQGRNRFQNIRSNPVTQFIYEHLSPQASKLYGGVEHHRNITLLDAQRNAIKSDKMPSRQAMEAAGIPLTKQSAIQMDFAGTPVLPPKQRRAIILADLEQQRPTARSINRTLEGLSTKVFNPVLQAINNTLEPPKLQPKQKTKPKNNKSRRGGTSLPTLDRTSIQASDTQYFDVPYRDNNGELGITTLPVPTI